MELNKEILKKSDKPYIDDKYVLCFNFDLINKVFNMGVFEIKHWLSDKDAIGVWKIK